MFIVLSQKCSSCGGEMIIKKFSDYPSELEIKELENEIGGNICINSFIFDLSEENQCKIKPEII